MNRGIRDVWIMNILSVIVVGTAVLAVVGAELGWWSWE